jgi:ATP-dependent helicase Lhr and Lhr-like helicase
LPPSSSDTPAFAPEKAYDALHPEIRKWIREQQWAGLRPIQADATAAILGSGDDVLISAGTAAGKTEAAFLPALTQAAGDAAGGLSILYVAPLKALINDQFGRLTTLCERLELPVVRWHGDAPQAAKARLVAKPHGIALITPESIEAMFVRRAAAARALFGRLRFIIIDEVHAFVGGVRGTHLASLLRRIDALAKTPARRIGLSATLGDPRMAAAWLRPGAPEGVRLLVAEGRAEIQLQVRGYLVPDERASSAEPEEGPSESTGLDAVADHLFARLRGSNNLVFGGSRQRVEALADRLRRRCDREGVPNEFFPHHGNLSKDLREELELRLKDDTLPTTAVCTSTLELGIDIGSVGSVAQVGAPRSLSALRQRLGRSGRRKGTPSILRVYVLEEELPRDPDPLDEMRPAIVMAVAAVRLLLAKFIEPPDGGQGTATALLHQSLSVIAERGGARADTLYRTLCGPGPFASVPPPLFARLLRGMGSPDARLIEQAPDGMLMLGEVGEKVVGSRDFYALFESSEEWRLVNGGRALGTIPLNNPVAPDSLLVFAGRRWVVLSVDERSRVIEVAPHRGGSIPTFERGSVEPIHDRLAAEMLAAYREAEVPAWLDPVAADLLGQGRAAFRRHGADKARILQHGRETHLLTWRGTRLNGLLAAALTRPGLRCEAHDLGVSAVLERGEEGEAAPDLRAALEAIASDPPDVMALATRVGAVASAKFDALVPEEVLKEFWAVGNVGGVVLLPEVASGLLAVAEG